MYKMSNSPLNTVLEHTYLGICLHYKLSLELHVNYSCGKANCLLGFMKKNLHNAPMEIKEYLYKQFLLNIAQLSGILPTKQQLAN